MQWNNEERLQCRQNSPLLLESYQGKIPLIEVPDFVELSFGDLEGVVFSEANQKYPKEMFDLRQAPDKYNPVAFNGETYLEDDSKKYKSSQRGSKSSY